MNSKLKNRSWLLTVAPRNYDGFGTITFQEYNCRRGPARLVSVSNEHLDWQVGRYSSGLYTPWNVTVDGKLDSSLLNKALASEQADYAILTIDLRKRNSEEFEAEAAFGDVLESICPPSSTLGEHEAMRWIREDTNQSADYGDGREPSYRYVVVIREDLKQDLKARCDKLADDLRFWKDEHGELGAWSSKMLELVWLVVKRFGL